MPGLRDGAILQHVQPEHDPGGVGRRQLLGHRATTLLHQRSRLSKVIRMTRLLVDYIRIYVRRRKMVFLFPARRRWRTTSSCWMPTTPSLTSTFGGATCTRVASATTRRCATCANACTRIGATRRRSATPTCTTGGWATRPAPPTTLSAKMT